ncbi:histidine kinase N-terminal 7TM domain-containing protein [Natrinema amylolyticum]|uniref:histidine kinase N-terminal 7TM domain-containing protein n=1 Tax=Natrinema amylolyticum TaxID=2878679 RepID=UPI001CFB0EF8|nr:histidine kinase N-terminal 7TM domain-containing protein [Natrinema amylolyticum]
MNSAQLISATLATGAVLVVLTTYPYLATAIAYRDRDNGLSYIVFLMGVAVWNGLFAAQVMDPRPIVKGFFFSIATLGAVLAGVGWLLFASTASSTPSLPYRETIYRLVALLAGLEIALAITNPAHALYWQIAGGSSDSLAFTVIDPNVGYWIHTAFLVALFGAGTVLFGLAWRRGTDVRYTRSYAIVGAATTAAIVGSNVFFTGTASLAPLVAGSLTTIGWVQAQQKRYLQLPRPYRWIGNFLQ